MFLALVVVLLITTADQVLRRILTPVVAALLLAAEVDFVSLDSFFGSQIRRRTLSVSSSCVYTGYTCRSSNKIHIYTLMVEKCNLIYISVFSESST